MPGNANHPAETKPRLPDSGASQAQRAAIALGILDDSMRQSDHGRDCLSHETYDVVRFVAEGFHQDGNL
jgi:hypothetical protein